jgi:hypothetical protein
VTDDVLRGATTSTVRTDNAERFEFPVVAAEFLTGVYGRTIDGPRMPGNFPGDDPQVLGPSDSVD